MAKTAVSRAAIARVMKATAKQTGGQIPKGHYVGGLQRSLAQASATAPAAPVSSPVKLK